MSYRCCDCGEIKASEPEIESHINADHIGWRPYQCFYCNQNGVTTRKPSKSMLRDHVTERHPDQQFTYLYTDDEAKSELLKDMMLRSKLDQQHAEVAAAPMTLSIVNAKDKISESPFLISPSKIKTEVLDITNEKQFGKSQETPQMAMNDNDIITIDDDDDDIKRNIETTMEMISNRNTTGNCRCETCQKLVPRNLTIIRDHVKVHFKEKTGCFPLDLSKLPHNLQQIYYDLLSASFPVEAASILKNDMMNTIETINVNEKMECETNEVSETIHNVTNSKLTNSGSCISRHGCKKCGEQFEKLTSLTVHEQRWCRSKKVLQQPSYNCSSCGKRFESFRAFSIHRCSSTRNKQVSERAKREKSASVSMDNKYLNSKRLTHLPQISKQGTRVVQSQCNKCKINLGTTRDNIIAKHLLNYHMNKRSYACSICEKYVLPSTIKNHDSVNHKGLGKAVCIYNVDQYHNEIKELQKKLITKVGGFKSSNPLAVNKLPAGLKKFVHSNNEPSTYTCSKCGRRFGSQYGKNAHKCWLGRMKTVLAKKMQKTKRTADVSTVCDVCNRRFISKRSLHMHQSWTHGIVGVENHCRKCRINVGTSNFAVSKHLLNIHVKKGTYECSICKKCVLPKTIEHHDLVKHKGLGRARCIYNIYQYACEIQELRKKLIGKLGNSTDSKPTASPKKKLKPKTQINHSVKNDTSHSSKELSPPERTRETDQSENLWQRSIKHGQARWYCKECKTNLDSRNVKRHLLTVHLKKCVYQCSLCNNTNVRPGDIGRHDRAHHDGQGANIIRNSERYEQQLSRLRKKLIVDANSMATLRTEDSPEKMISVVPSINHQKPITVVPSKSLNHRDTLKCTMSRSQQSQKHKLSEQKRRVLKNPGFKKDFARRFLHAAKATPANVVAPSITAVSKMKSESTEELLINESSTSRASSENLTAVETLATVTEPSLITIEMATTESEMVSSASEIMASLIPRDLSETERCSPETESTVQTTETAQPETALTEDGEITMSITEP